MANLYPVVKRLDNIDVRFTAPDLGEVVVNRDPNATYYLVGEELDFNEDSFTKI